MQPQSQKTKNDMPAINPEMEVPRPDLPATTKPAISPAKFDPQTTTASGIGETEVDAWYEKLDAGILSWEMKEMAKIEVQLAWPQPRTFNVKTIEIKEVGQMLNLIVGYYFKETKTIYSIDAGIFNCEVGLAPRGLISSPRHILDQSLHLLVTAEVAVARDVAVGSFFENECTKNEKYSCERKNHKKGVEG
ncbi:hypothetical protein GH714_030197 [Hevea brasiliensis]|uniref:Uncharacterized protein n=1 Tax=Hevea brasiliensis TaxID=3981 RepID=A0A6A6LP87_HEVBR|nr:hypothetical protein GH714_030197 [Hevea brasiliensis]